MYEIICLTLQKFNQGLSINHFNWVASISLVTGLATSTNCFEKISWNPLNVKLKIEELYKRFLI